MTNERTTAEMLQDSVNRTADELQTFTYEMNDEGEYRDEDGIPTSVGTWLEDCLDIDFTVETSADSGLYFKSCTITTCIGGPGIWVDTAAREVRGAWGNDRATAYLPTEVCEAINREVYELCASYRGIAWM